MIFLLGCFLILLVIYYFYNFSTNKESLVNSETFIPSNKFKGYKQGYVFKNCSKGLGYYKDKYGN